MEDDRQVQGLVYEIRLIYETHMLSCFMTHTALGSWYDVSPISFSPNNLFLKQIYSTYTGAQSSFIIVLISNMIPFFQEDTDLSRLSN